MEAGYARNNLGIISREAQKDYKQAFSYYTEAIEFYNHVIEIDPNYRPALMAQANSYSGAALSAAKIKQTEEALKYINFQIGIYDNILEQEKDNYQLIFKRAGAQTNLLLSHLIPENSQAYDALIQDISKGFKIATLRDPDNKTWKKAYEQFQDKYLTDSKLAEKNP